MVWRLFSTRPGTNRAGSRAAVPRPEALESRNLLSGTTVAVGMATARLNPSLRYDHIETRRDEGAGALGTISGTITDSATGKPIRGVRVQLLDADGDLVGKTVTKARGRYSFKVSSNGAYVVREVTPKRYTQVSPTFATTPPVGAMTPGFGGNSWSYSTGNNDPTAGPVGVYWWDTVAPAGDLPFQSPINITGPPTDLSKYLSVSLTSTAPKAIIDNGHSIQVQFAESSADTINLGGTAYELAQFHYHDPSENLVNGKGYSMEEHFVFASAAGAEAVVAVFLQLGAHNSALQPILDAASSSLTTPNTTTTLATPIDFAGLLPSSLQGWSYEGSLTSPALSQPVNWLVLSAPITLDYAQLKQYEAVAKAGGFLPNARPVQPLDGRQLNEIDYDVNFQNQSIGDLNFSLAPSNGVTVTASAKPTMAGTASAMPALQVLSPGGNPSVTAAATSQNLQPVPGCNCALCQALRNAVWHQVSLKSALFASSPS